MRESFNTQNEMEVINTSSSYKITSTRMNNNNIGYLKKNVELMAAGVNPTKRKLGHWLIRNHFSFNEMYHINSESFIFTR